MSPTPRKLAVCKTAVRKTAARKTAGTKQASAVTRNSSLKKAAAALEPQRANGPHSNSQNALLMSLLKDHGNEAGQGRQSGLLSTRTVLKRW
ncbi:hypothetical protein ACEPAG_3547 [Sanghuangporus baumii]